jgi:hypothetical protein
METSAKGIADLMRKIEKQKKKDPDAVTYEYIVPRETIFTEIVKCFKENPVRALDILNDSGALDLLLPEVVAMQGVEQHPEHHAEGDVWEHTRLMLSNLNSEFFRNQFPDYKPSGEFALAVLFHDIGKPDTQTMPQDENDRIRFNGHDQQSVKIIADIVKRFKVATDIADMWKFCAGHHMFIMSTKDIGEIRLSKIAHRFMDAPYSKELFMLFHLDSSATLRPDGTLPMENFETVVGLLEQIKEIRANQPKKILDGDEIIEFFGLSKRESPFVGVAISVLSEFVTQGKINSKDEAMAFLSKHSVIFAEAIQELNETIKRQDAGEKIRFNNDEMAERILKKIGE